MLIIIDTIFIDFLGGGALLECSLSVVGEYRFETAYAALEKNVENKT